MRVGKHTAQRTIRPDFPSFSEGLSLRARRLGARAGMGEGFPFLFGGTFIEGCLPRPVSHLDGNFPSFSEGLSLRVNLVLEREEGVGVFPFLFGGTFIEGPP